MHYYAYMKQTFLEFSISEREHSSTHLCVLYIYYFKCVCDASYYNSRLYTRKVRKTQHTNRNCHQKFNILNLMKKFLKYLVRDFSICLYLVKKSYSFRLIAASIYIIKILSYLLGIYKTFELYVY